MLLAAMRLANKKQYNWQASAKFFLPANYNSVARQFLRCTLHKLQNNEILFQLFQCVELSNEPVLLETLSSALADWTELSAVAALRQLFADLNKRRKIKIFKFFKLNPNTKLINPFLKQFLTCKKLLA